MIIILCIICFGVGFLTCLMVSGGDLEKKLIEKVMKGNKVYIVVNDQAVFYEKAGKYKVKISHGKINVTEEFQDDEQNV